jgi:hypothetical protein
MAWAFDYWGRFPVYKELSTILDAQHFHTFLRQKVGHKSHEKVVPISVEFCEP